MKRSELERTLGTKLQMASDPRRQHVTYTLRIEGKLVLPQSVRVSHGSGELTDREKGSAARDLFLRERELEVCVKCHIGAQCVFICIAVELLHRVAEKDPEAMPKSDLSRDSEGIGTLIRVAEAAHMNGRWTPPEKALLERISSRLHHCLDAQHTRTLAGRIHQFVTART